MNIGVWANDGSPMGIIPEDMWGSSRRVGIGGAELALFTVLEGLAERGHEVTLFNNPVSKSKSKINLRHHAEFPHYKNDFDSFIVFRSPTPIVITCQLKRGFGGHVTKLLLVIFPLLLRRWII